MGATLALTEAARDRLSKLLGMLGSDHAGERDNAAVAANRIVQDAGLTWDQVLRRPMPAWVGEPRKPPPPRPATWAPWDDAPGEDQTPPPPTGERKPKRAKASKTSPKPKPQPWQDVVKLLLTKHNTSLSAWEMEFLGGLHRFRELSEKQRAVLGRIAERVLGREVAL